MGRVGLVGIAAMALIVGCTSSVAKGVVDSTTLPRPAARAPVGPSTTDSSAPASTTSTSVDVAPSSAVLRLVLSASSTHVRVGQSFTYDVGITNTGPTSLDEVAVSGAYPYAEEQATHGCGAALGSLRCPFGRLAPGASRMASVTFRALQIGAIRLVMEPDVAGLSVIGDTATVTVTVSP